MADIFDIAGRINSTSQEKVVTTADQIKDEIQNKKQNTINADVARHENEIHGTGGIDSRVTDLEAMEQIVIDGGDAQIATGADFTNPDATKRAKVPTVGAIVDGLNDGIYDVSKRNPTAGPNSDGKFTLDYILSNADTLIPTGWRHGGMIISFVDSSDNKYVQFRFLLSGSFTAAQFTNEANWQGADEEPVAGSRNFVESGGVFPVKLKTDNAISEPFNNLASASRYNDTRLMAPIEPGTYYGTQFAESVYSVNVYNAQQTIIGTLGSYATTGWNDTFTLPAGTAFLTYPISSSYPNGFFGKQADYLKYSEGKRVSVLNSLDIPQIKEYVDPEIEKVNTVGENFNLIDNAIITQDGDYKRRKFSINGNTEYYISVLAPGMIGWVSIHDASGGRIGYIDDWTNSWNTTFTSPSNAASMIIFANSSDAYAETMYVGAESSYEKWQSGFRKPLLSTIYAGQSDNNELLSIGIGTAYPNLKDGFAYADENNLGVLIAPGVYDLVSEGVTGKGLDAPKHIIGYGVTIQANLSSVDNEFSPLNINKDNKETIIEGITVICDNCRYALHDEMYNRAGFYHNVYRDCKFVSNGLSSQEWAAPRAVGGGLGNFAYIEFINCEFESNVNYGDLDYHSNGSGTQTGNCEVHISNCVFENAVQCTPIGSSTSFMNKVYVSGCLFGRSLPSSHEDTNIKMIAWGNVLNS